MILTRRQVQKGLRAAYDQGVAARDLASRLNGAVKKDLWDSLDFIG